MAAAASIWRHACRCKGWTSSSSSSGARSRPGSPVSRSRSTVAAGRVALALLPRFPHTACRCSKWTRGEATTGQRSRVRGGGGEGDQTRPPVPSQAKRRPSPRHGRTSLPPHLLPGPRGARSGALQPACRCGGACVPSDEASVHHKGQAKPSPIVTRTAEVRQSQHTRLAHIAHCTTTGFN